MKFSVELNSAPKQNTRFSSSLQRKQNKIPTTKTHWVFVFPSPQLTDSHHWRPSRHLQCYRKHIAFFLFLELSFFLFSVVSFAFSLSPSLTWTSRPKLIPNCSWPFLWSCEPRFEIMPWSACTGLRHQIYLCNIFKIRIYKNVRVCKNIQIRETFICIGIPQQTTGLASPRFESQFA